MEARQPLVSVLMPCYNEVNYLISSVESIISQTYQEWELVVVDDGSNEATKALLQECCTLDSRYSSIVLSNDSRVKLLSLSTNCGIVEALNHGLKHCTGKYVARMDSDDIALPDRIERQVRFLEEQTNVHLVGGGVKIIGETPENGTIYCPPCEVGTLHSSLFFSCSVFHPTLMARREIFEQFVYPSEYPISEDWALWLQIVASESHSFKFTTLPLPEVLHYRRHSNNSSKVHRSKQEESSVRSLADILKSITKEEDDFLQVAKVLVSRSKHEFPAYILEKAGTAILKIESFLLSRNFTANEKDQIQAEMTRRLGEIAALSLTLFPNPSDSTVWRSWLSRNPMEGLMMLMSLSSKPKPKPQLAKGPANLSKVTVVCFSKDRAWQLKEWLRTLFLHVKNMELDVHVLYKPIGQFVKSYQKVKEEYSNVNWVEEIDFASQLREIVSNAADFLLWGVDDVMYFRDVDLSESVHVLHENPEIISSTLRLTPQMNYCHTVDKTTTVPHGVAISAPAAKGLSEEGAENPVLKFDRREGTYDWNYPFELCATLYRKEDVISYFNEIESRYGREGLSHPNKLEVCGSRLFKNNHHPDASKYYCTCLSYPVLGVITVNRVQDVCGAPIYDENEMTVEELDVFLWNDSEYDEMFYVQNAPKMKSCHIGDFQVKTPSTANF